MGNERAKKKSLTTQELEIEGVSAIAKQKQVFGVPHKELKTEEACLKGQKAACDLRAALCPSLM